MKKKKKSPKSMEELTKGYKEFEERNEVKKITKKGFTKLVKQLSKKKP